MGVAFISAPLLTKFYTFHTVYTRTLSPDLDSGKPQYSSYCHKLCNSADEKSLTMCSCGTLQSLMWLLGKVQPLMTRAGIPTAVLGSLVPISRSSCSGLLPGTASTENRLRLYSIEDKTMISFSLKYVAIFISQPFFVHATESG